MFPSGPSATSFGWLMPVGKRADHTVRGDPLDAVVERVGDVHRAVGRDRQPVGAVEARERRDCSRCCVAPLHASEQLGDEEVSRGVVRECRRLLELRDGGDRPGQIDVADPALAVDDPEAAARIDGDLDREADRRPDGRTAVTGVPRPAVAREESQPVTVQAEDAVREVRDQQ